MKDESLTPDSIGGKGLGREKPFVSRDPSHRPGRRPGLAQEYDYHLPERFIAQAPASPRDAAKLLVFDRQTQEITIDTFRHLGSYLPKGAVLVMNETKVIPARVMAKKDTGGKIELLVLEWHGRDVTVITDRRLNLRQWVIIGATRLQVVSQHDAEFTLRMDFSPTKFIPLLERFGAPPVPPYIRHSPLSHSAIKKQYQTVFAKNPGSAAAPTASLHFTGRLLSALHRHGIAIEFVTLHVGLGTFAPLTAKNIKTGRLHAEIYEISRATAARLNHYKSQGRPIIAVGTTVARTLESAMRRGHVLAGRSSTDIFIKPRYRWQFVDGLITNFHVPRSSLMMLVASLIGRERLLALYAFAQRKKFRFFSFGDGMLIK